MYTITHRLNASVCLQTHVKSFASHHRPENPVNIVGLSYVTLDGEAGEVRKDDLVAIMPYVHRPRTRKISD